VSRREEVPRKSKKKKEFIRGGGWREEADQKNKRVVQVDNERKTSERICQACSSRKPAGRKDSGRLSRGDTFITLKKKHAEGTWPNGTPLLDGGQPRKKKAGENNALTAMELSCTEERPRRVFR